MQNRGRMISEAFEKLRKNSEKLQKMISIDDQMISIFWDLEKIAVNPAPLCTVPEDKEKFTSPKRGVSNFFQ
jgi:hypothetical protein